VRKRYVGVVAGIAILAVAVLISSGIAQGKRIYPQIPGIPIGASIVYVNGDQLWPPPTELPNWTALRAFIETGSDSPVILATLSDMTYATSVQALVCLPRELDGKRGIVVSIFFNNPEVGLDFFAGVTLYQQGARHYAAPVVYQGD
jgi:hypothetical protein